MTRPEPTEAAPYYFTYINRISTDDIVRELEEQAGQMLEFLERIPADRTGHRYSPEKWSVREVLSHINDTERVMAFRAFWFARGFEGPMPSFDQDIATGGAGAEDIAWAAHIEDFRAIRAATLTLFRNLPAGAWKRAGVASGNAVTVRALAYIIAGHAAHHRAILEERYLRPGS